MTSGEHTVSLLPRENIDIFKCTCSQIHIRHTSALICSSGSVQSPQAQTEADSTVKSAITDGTSKIICATQTVYQVNNSMNTNDQLALENMLSSHTHAF